MNLCKNNIFIFRKFAPRCCVCKQPIMPEPGQEETVRVVALDRSFHIQCYKCEVIIILTMPNYHINKYIIVSGLRFGTFIGG